MAEAFDIVSPEFHANPFPTLDRMRAAGALVQLKLPIVGRTWLTTTHAATVELLKDHERVVRGEAARARRVVVALRERARGTEPAQAERCRGIFRTAGNHEIRVAVLNEPRAETDAVRARRAGRHDP